MSQTFLGLMTSTRLLMTTSSDACRAQRRTGRWILAVAFFLLGGCSQGGEGIPCSPSSDGGGRDECNSGLTCQRPAKCTSYYCCPTPASLSSNANCNSSACTAS